MRIAAIVAAASCVASIASAQTLTLIEIDGYMRGSPGAIDFVYDDMRETLFISTSQGAIDRFHVPSATLLPRWETGSFTPAVDITPDGAKLLVTETATQPGSQHGLREGRLHVVNPDTGAVSAVTWEVPDMFGIGSWDVAATADGRAFVTPDREASSGSEQLREIRLDSGAVTTRLDSPISVQLGAELFRSPTGSRLFLQGKGVAAVFDVGMDEFISSAAGFVYASFNHDGTLLASNLRLSSPLTNDLRILNERFHAIALIPEEGVLAHAFDPVRDRFYLAIRGTGDFVAVSRSEWSEIGRIRAPHSLDARMEITPDGSAAFIESDDGIVMIEIPEVFPACAANCDENYALDIFDFVCFQDAFVAMDPYADCDGSGMFDIFDFICFQDAFTGGCP